MIWEFPLEGREGEEEKERNCRVSKSIRINEETDRRNFVKEIHFLVGLI